MSIMAYWGPMTFEVSTNRIAVLQNLTTSLTLKEDSENDTSGTEPTNTRGRDLRPMSFEILYHAGAGNNPRAMIAAWESLLGHSYPLVIGGQRFGEGKMKLKNVSTKDIQLTNSGGFIQAAVSISLEEYSEGKISKLLDEDEEEETEEENEEEAPSVREEIFGSGGGTGGGSSGSPSTGSDDPGSPDYLYAYAPETGRRKDRREALAATASKSDKAERKPGARGSSFGSNRNGAGSFGGKGG